MRGCSPLFSASGALWAQTHGPFLAQATPCPGCLRALIRGLCLSSFALFTVFSRLGQAEALSRRRTRLFLGTRGLSASHKNDTSGLPAAPCGEQRPPKAAPGGGRDVVTRLDNSPATRGCDTFEKRMAKRCFALCFALNAALVVFRPLAAPSGELPARRPLRGERRPISLFTHTRSPA